MSQLGPLEAALLRSEMMRSALSAALLVVAVTACSATRDPYNPGTSLGTYHVVGHVASNNCGTGIGATDPWEFDIQLSTDPGILYWVQGGPAVSGSMDASSHATMTATDTRTIHDANPKAGIAYCGVERDDDVDMTLSSDQKTFTGSLQYAFSPTSDSDCSDQLVSAGGTFDALPCTTKYTMTATRTAGPITKK